MVLYWSSPHDGFRPQKLRTARNRICEGGGTGRRARLRCVWFILGGSNPLLRTMTKTRMNAENSVFMWVFFVLFACRYSQIVTDILSFSHSRSRQKVVGIFSRSRSSPSTPRSYRARRPCPSEKRRRGLRKSSRYRDQGFTFCRVEQVLPAL